MRSFCGNRVAENERDHPCQAFGSRCRFSPALCRAWDHEAEYSDLYGDIMDARIDSEYEVTLQADEGTAQGRVEDARRFVDRVVRYLSDVEGIRL